MGFTAVAVVVGLALGLAAGGRLTNLGRSPLRWWGALWAGVLLQVVGEVVELRRPVAVVFVLASYTALGVFALANLARRGMPVVLVGLTLNAVVIGVNGSMPVREDAIAAAGIDAAAVDAVDLGSKRHLEERSDHLTALADVIPLRPLHQVVSFGDLILAAGMVVLLVHLVRPARSVRRAVARPA